MFYYKEIESLVTSKCTIFRTFKLWFIIFALVFEKGIAVVEIGLEPASTQTEVLSEDGDKSILPPPLNNLTRCSRTELTLSQEALVYTWEMKGFLDYFTFMKKFEQIFELKTEEVSFKSDIVDGKWFFKLSKVILSPGKDDLIITSTYSYEAQQAKKLNFHIQLSITNDEKEIVLPVQKSINPIVMQQRLYNRRGYSSYLEYTHTFTWINVAQAVDNILKSQSTSATIVQQSSEMADDDFNYGTDGGGIRSSSFISRNEDILLRFIITAYFPSDPVYKGSENCPSISSAAALQGLIRDGDARTSANKPIIPPYLKHSNSMLHDDRFADVILKFGKQQFLAHRIILATSSPVFSAIFYNETEGSENEIEINNGSSRVLQTIVLDDNLPAEVITEMFRYIYTGRISLDKMTDKFIQAADKYGLAELKRMCEKILLPQIKISNAIEMYDLGHQVNSARIIRRAFTVMKGNKSKIVSQSEEFRRLASKHPNLMFELFVSL